ncbi:MAG: hypothetical protein HXX14_09970 [Bacteroidetes bacterium]|nr:hypothetical protein [Bacteroidota bacterium]
MAQLKGPMQFTGSVGNIRSYYDKRLKRYILSTKGGASKDIILNNPAFARTRENMNDFSACSMWASLLRMALSSIMNLYRGNYFSDIVSYGKKIQKFDTVNAKGKREVASSKASSLLKLIHFNEDQPFDRTFCSPLRIAFSDDKKSVALQIKSFQSFGQLHWQFDFQSYRFSMIIFQLADMIWSEEKQKYKPVVDGLDKLTKIAVSDWQDRSVELVDFNLEASFAEPALQQPGTTVVVALGIEVSCSPVCSLNHTAAIGGTMGIVACFV